MKGMIMAGGSGQRLRPVTCLTPKPLLPVLGRPVMETALMRLNEIGIREVGATLSYRAELICERFSGRVRCFVENKPLGTAGSLLQARDFLNESFVVVSGDALTDMDLGAAIRFHKERGALATMVLKKVEDPLEYGVVLTDKQGRVQRFLEKPGWDQVFSDQVNTGIYILEPRILDLIPEDCSYDFGRELFPLLLERKLPLYGFVTDSYWCDIGGVSAYIAAHMDALSGRIRGFSPGIEAGAVIEEGANVIQPVWIGAGSRVCAGASVGPNCAVGRDCCIRPGASVRESVLLDGVLVGERAELRGCLLLPRAQVLRAGQMYDHSVLGDGAVLGEGASLLDGAMVWPEKQVPAGTRLRGNLTHGRSPLVWQSRGVCARSAAQMEPERFAGLGDALARAMRGPVLLAEDGSPAAQMAASALAAGAAAAGSAVLHAGVCSPQAMLAVREDVSPSAAYLYLRDGALCADLYDRQGLEMSHGQRRALQTELALESTSARDISQIGRQETIPGATAARLMRLLLLCGAEKGADEVQLQLPKGPLEEEAQALFRPGGQIRAVVHGDLETFDLTDERGRLVEAHRLPLVYAFAVHAFAPGAPVMGAWQDSLALDELAKSYGVACLRCEPGRRARMEMTQRHPFYRTMYFDPLGALALLLRALEREKQSLAELMDRLPQTRLLQKELPCKNGDKGAVLRDMAFRLEDRRPALSHGIRLETKAGAVAFLYPSQAQESFTLRCEASDAEAADELFSEMEQLLAQSLAAADAQ